MNPDERSSSSNGTERPRGARMPVRVYAHSCVTDRFWPARPARGQARGAGARRLRAFDLTQRVGSKENNSNSVPSPCWGGSGNPRFCFAALILRGYSSAPVPLCPYLYSQIPGQGFANRGTSFASRRNCSHFPAKMGTEGISNQSPERGLHRE